MDILSFNKKYDSLAYLVSEYGKKILKKEFNDYNYKIPNLALHVGNAGFLVKTYVIPAAFLVRASAP